MEIKSGLKALKKYEDIQHFEQRQKISEIIDFLYFLGGSFNNRFKDTIIYLEGYVNGSNQCENAIERGNWERHNNELS